ncbi:MAG TPA: penicillin acylase family protein [Nocardioidaceae bacterium]|nr:penicillin acylase family protein [Nocardioidaceae bacterium]
MPESSSVVPAGAEGGPRSGFRSWPRAGRWAAYTAGVVVLVVLALLITVLVVVRRSFPQTSGEIQLPGLEAKVAVLRDGSGIPQIYADTPHDLFYAQGYVQAQDRFFEMDVRRHITAGRLSELFGRSTLKTDEYIRTMGWRRVAQHELSLLSPRTVRYLRAYSAGVNAYIHTHTPSQMSLEYSVLALNGLDYTPQDWSPVDSVSWLKAMAWDLRGNMGDEIERALDSVRLSPAQIDQLFPPYPYRRHRPIVDQGAVVDGVYEQDAATGATRNPKRPPLDPAAVQALRRLRKGLKAIPQMLGEGAGIGSNAWAVDGAHSTTGMPILANDPHLATSVPGIWYQMGLHCRHLTAKCPFDVTGFTFSGMPGVVIGHNEQIAWGFTNLGPDVTDLYLEKVRDDSYLYAGAWHPLVERKETIEVAGGKPVTLTVRSTRHGPLISDVSKQLSTVGADAPVEKGAPPRGHGYAVALDWTALIPSTTMDALFEIDSATDWKQFRRGARDFAVPAQNMVYADRAGHIGYQAPGMIPIRKSGNSGDYPMQGWLKSDDWTGKFVPFDALPSVLDPEDGFVATANQAVTEPSYPFYLGDSWAPGYRSQRIVDLLQRKARVSPADMAQIQLDTRNGFAPTFVPYLLKILLPSEYLAGGQRLLQDWDYTFSADSAAAAYYSVVWKETLALTFHDQLGHQVWPSGDGRWFEVMRRLLAHPHSQWWDDVNTKDRVETRDDILTEALTNARDELVRLEARDPAKWSWGHLHQLDLENQTIGQSDIGLVRWLFNRGGWQVAGTGSVVDATHWDAASDSYDVTAGPSMRMVVSLADLDKSRWVNLTGASGHAFDDHYTDQTDLWADGRTLAWPFTPKAVRAATDDMLTLAPKRPSGG